MWMFILYDVDVYIILFPNVECRNLFELQNLELMNIFEQFSKYFSMSHVKLRDSGSFLQIRQMQCSFVDILSNMQSLSIHEPPPPTPAIDTTDNFDNWYFKYFKVSSM